ncbi:MAG: hypothetical protein JNL90_13030 [Planctomycetes bacterium]|nr:hypothetical protein [Planctomycetota bacterium]
MNRPHWLEPRWLQRHVRIVVLLLGGALVFFGLRDLRFVAIAADDDSTPSIEAGGKAVVKTLADDDFELERDALYLFDRTGDATEIGELRLARLLGLPGDVVQREPLVVAAGERAERTRVRIGAAERVVPTELAELLPDVVPAGRVLLFTDNPACRHPDSRALGPLPIERLKLRVVASFGLLPR